MKLYSLFLLLVATAVAEEVTLTPEAIAADRKLWPKAVTVQVEHQVPLQVNGKTAGTMKAPAGRQYPVKAVTASEVSVDAHGSVLNIPVNDTDLVALATERQAQLAAMPAPAAATPIPAAQVQATPAPTPAPLANPWPELIGADLIVRDGRKFVPFDTANLAGKKYIGVYFSAAWCPPCRGFTPKLVSWYKRKKSSLKDFDIIFVSADKTQEEMENYMKTDDMDWPAVSVGTRTALKKFGGRGIPCLVVIDEKGAVISDSYENGEYVGPEKVMDDLNKLLSEAKKS